GQLRVVLREGLGLRAAGVGQVGNGLQDIELNDGAVLGAADFFQGLLLLKIDERGSSGLAEGEILLIEMGNVALAGGQVVDGGVQALVQVGPVSCQDQLLLP